MRSPKRGEVFRTSLNDSVYMSLMDKGADMIRCLSQETKRQTSISKKSIEHVFSAEESASMMRTFFEGG